MSDWHLFLGDALAIAGTAAMTLAMVGIWRIPSTYVKIHASSAAVVLGVLMVLTATWTTGDAAIIARAFLVGSFLLATAPLAAHALARLARLEHEDPR